MMSEKAQDATRALLAKCPPEGSICPSQVARAISVDGNWRAAMPRVHAASDDLLRKGIIQISWKGQKLQSRAGPYRITACADAKGGGADQ